MVKVLVPLADGFEDVEAVAVIDVLRRAGIQVDTAGIMGNIVTSMNKIKVHTETRLIDLDESGYDGIILPGGPGYQSLMKSDKLNKIVDSMAKSGKVVAAICAAPLILAKRGLLNGVRATIYPGMEKDLDMPRGDKVIVDKNFITSQGPGTAMEFALRIVEHFMGKEKSAILRRQLLV